MSVLQCVAVCCSVLKCVAVCCSVLTRHGVFVFPHTTIRNDALVSIYIYLSIISIYIYLSITVRRVGQDVLVSEHIDILSECTWRVRVYPHNNQK